MALWHQHMTSRTLHLRVITEAKARASTRSKAGLRTGASTMTRASKETRASTGTSAITKTKASASHESKLGDSTFLVRHQQTRLWLQRWQQCSFDSSHSRRQCMVAQQKHQHHSMVCTKSYPPEFTNLTISYPNLKL